MRVMEFVRRFAQGLFGGTLAMAGFSLVEAWWATGAGGEGAPSISAGALVIFPLLVPVGLVVSALVALACAWLWPEEPPSLSAGIGWLRSQATGRRAEIAAIVPLVVLATFIWTTGVAHLTRSLLGTAVSARLAGLAVMTGALAVGLVLAILTLALVPPLRRTLARWAEPHPAVLDPALTGGVALVLTLLLFVFGMMSGTVSGEGGWLGIWGIFKRAELDLRAPSELLMVALVTLAAQNSARPPRSLGKSSLALLVLLSVAPLGLLQRSGQVLEESSNLSLAIERGAPLSKLVLGPLRRSSDHDGDGYSGKFGGGDCDDSRADVHPGAEEVLDNGVDEDCSGADLTKRAVDALAPHPEAQKVDERLFSKDLNVIVISIDTLRFDLGMMGYKRPISPNLDALAARSVLFERAYSLASYTGKSIGPMLIGKYGSETDRNWGHFNKFGEKDTFLAERLKRQGVHTMAVHGHRYFDDFGGLDRGFELLDFSAAPPKNAPWDVDTKSSGAELTDAAIALLEKPENVSGRFFMWVHYLDPHADYLRHDGIDFGNGARDLYDGEVAFTDQQIGRLLQKIDQSPWGKRTAIVVTSDHGEVFGEHGMYRHGFEVWESLVRVPLIVHVPGARSKRVKARRSLIDLAPTVLELMHAPLPGEEAADSGDFLSGQSLLVDVFLPEGSEPSERDVLVDMPAGPYNDARRALIHGSHKLIVAGDSRFSLFDVDQDPGELDELSGKDKEAMREMKDRYAAQKARLREIQVTGKRK